MFLKQGVIRPVLFKPALEIAECSASAEFDGDDESGDAARSAQVTKESDHQQPCDCRAV